MKNLHNYYKGITYSFRIEQAMTINILSNINYKNQIICKKIADGVDIHRKAMELVILSDNIYIIIYLITIFG
jgi:hypothetical protein